MGYRKVGYLEQLWYTFKGFFGTRAVKHRGYIIAQDPNNHIMITKDGIVLYHASCAKRLSKKKLREHIDSFLCLETSGINDMMED